MTDDRPSKSRRKRDMHALQDLGEELVALNGERLDRLDLPERLRDAVMDARSISSFEARRRQLQYIGKLMRGIDPAPIRAALDGWRGQASRHTALHKRAEAWREQLLAGPGGLAALRAEHPRANTDPLAALVREALHERAANRPPRSYRALYQALRALLDEGGEL